MDTAGIPDADSIDLEAEFAPTVTANDARVAASAIGILHAQDASLDKAASLAVISKNDVGMSQSAGYWVVARRVEAENTGSAMMVAGNVKLSRGWVGILASPRVELSEDTRVFVGPAAAAVLGLAIVIVTGIVALVAPGLMRQAGEQWPDFDKQAMEWMHAHK